MRSIKLICSAFISFTLLSISYAHAIDDSQTRFERRRPVLREPIENYLAEGHKFHPNNIRDFMRMPPEDIKTEVFEKPLPKGQETWDAAQLRAEAEARQKAGDTEGYLYYINLAAEKEKEEDSDAEEDDKPGGKNHRRAVALDCLRLRVDSDPVAEREAKARLHYNGASEVVDDCAYVEKNSWVTRKFNEVSTYVGKATIGTAAGAAGLFLLHVIIGQR